MANDVVRMFAMLLLSIVLSAVELSSVIGQDSQQPPLPAPDEVDTSRSQPRLGRRLARLRRVEDPGVLFRWPGQRAGKIAGLDEPIVTDRPDFTEASSVVGRGVLQIESGYTYARARARHGGTQSHSYPESLFRYGAFANWLELRLYPTFSAEEFGGIRSSGIEDLYLGAKLGLTVQDGILPEMAVTPQMTVPTGSEEFTTGRTLAGANWLYGWDITERLAVGGSTQLNRRLSDAVGEYTEGATSLTVNCDLTKRWGHYSEWFAFVPVNVAIPTEHYFDGGFTYGFSNDVQWDIRGGAGLNDAASDFFVGTGLSVRFH